MKTFLPFASALLLWSSFHPLNLWPLAWVALVPLLAYIQTEPKRWKCWFFCWSAGFCFFVAGLWWIGYTAPYVGPPLIALYKGLYWAFFAGLVRLSSRVLPFTIAAPTVWVSLEFLRSYLFTGLPWLLLGYSQHDFSLLIQISDLTGVYGASFLVVFVNAVVAHAVTAPQKTIRREALAAGAMVLLSIAYGALRLNTLSPFPGPRLLLIQPNIPQQLKEAAKIDREKKALEIYQKHLDVTRRALGQGARPDLILWPESAIIYPILYKSRDAEWYSDPWYRRLTEPARDFQTRMVIGVEVIEPPEAWYQKQPITTSDCRVFNSAVYVDPERKVIDRYDKVHRVPFAEFQPTEWIRSLTKKFTGLQNILDFQPGTEFKVFDLSQVRFGVNICFEAAYPEIFRDPARKGAAFIVTISNDGWFRDSAELDQMLAMARFRAVENRRSVVRATNTGISCVINDAGQVESRLQNNGRYKEVEGWMEVVVPISTRGSLYTRFGDVFAWLCVLLAAGGLGGARWIRQIA